MMDLSHPQLAIIFASLTALSILVYAILDGYDLGVGICLSMSKEEWRDTEIASIGPFWDANETWLVLAVGLLLVAFPVAHSEILRVLYLPASLLLIALILRGVAFDFRAKVKPKNKIHWDICFKVGSILAAFSQGFMLGIYIMGLKYNIWSSLFAVFSGVCVIAAYALIGNTWLILKTSGELQKRAIQRSKQAGIVSFIGILTVCLVNPLVNANVLAVWTQLPMAYLYAAIPLLCFVMFALGYAVLKRLPLKNDSGAWLPFLMTSIVFVSCFVGLTLSFYPYVVPNTLTIYQAASAKSSLEIMLYGTLVVVPIIVMYTFIAYYAFRGKADTLRYY
ncbi:cytochrome d ubiquinol oxidase subunit II [Agaribacter flavus]|uniref:Cytochrome d ubiquinol oxidase subunit II n=1 Tax=Agaribacter flavus TaxID=1902781 RepID=A0ABV7FSH2_9ALTE